MQVAMAWVVSVFVATDFVQHCHKLCFAELCIVGNRVYIYRPMVFGHVLLLINGH